jgi:hypothetical protein
LREDSDDNLGTDAELIVQAPNHIGSGFPVFKVMQYSNPNAVAFQADNDGTASTSSTFTAPSVVAAQGGGGPSFVLHYNGGSQHYELDNDGSNFVIKDTTAAIQRLVINPDFSH